MADILINDSDRRIQFTATGGETEITYDFPIFASKDLVVELQPAAGGVAATLVEITDYTVNGVGAENGGTITLVVAATVNEVYTLYGDIAVERLTDFQQRGALRALTLNLEFDRIVQMIQQNERNIARAVQLTIEDTTALPMALPLLAARLDKVAGWDQTTGQFIATAVTVAEINQVIGGAIANASDQMADGGFAAPGLPFLNETTTGFSRPGAGQLGVSILGVKAMLLTSTVLEFTSATGNRADLEVKSDISANATVPARLSLFGESAAAAVREYGRFETEIVDNTNAAEDSKLGLHAMLEGALTKVLEIDPAGNMIFRTAGNSGVQVVSVAAGNVGVLDSSDHISPSPADDDKLYERRVTGQHDGSITSIAAQQAMADNVLMTSVVEDAEFARRDIYMVQNGTLNLEFSLGGGLVIGAVQTPKGVGTSNVDSSFVRGRIQAGWELIGETVITAVSAITFASLKDLDGIVDPFEAFVALITMASPATDDDELRIRVATGAASIDTGNNYRWVLNGQQASASLRDSATATSGILLASNDANEGIGNVADEGLSGVVYFLGVKDTTNKRMIAHVNFLEGGTGVDFVEASISGLYSGNADELDDIEFTWGSGGNFAAVGTISLYGLRRVGA